MPLNRETILRTLSKINAPGSGKDLVSANVVKGLNITSDAVSFVIEIDPIKEEEYQKIKSLAETEIKKLKEHLSVRIFLTSHNKNPEPSSAKTTPNLRIGKHPEPQTKKLKPSGTNHIIAIGSGKGGVGKSTLTANLAIALSKLGLKIGLLDADIYGPSQPKIMGASGKPQIGGSDSKTILPLQSYGITIMSMGFLVNDDEAVVWRGPMLMGALQQFLGQVEWGNLDILLIDLPPGTGDVQLTLGQKCALSGAIIVSTPQDVALIDAKKAMQMFYKLNIPLLGMVENMSMYICEKCGHKELLFGHGGVQEEAKKAQIPFLGEIPLDIKIRQASDEGKPIVVSDFTSPQSTAFVQIAERIFKELNFEQTNSSLSTLSH